MRLDIPLSSIHASTMACGLNGGINILLVIQYQVMMLSESMDTGTHWPPCSTKPARNRGREEMCPCCVPCSHFQCLESLANSACAFFPIFFGFASKTPCLQFVPPGFMLLQLPFLWIKKLLCVCDFPC